MAGVPGVGGQNRAFGTNKKPSDLRVPDVRPKANKRYYWQSLKKTTSVDKIRKELLKHLKGFNVEAPDDLIRHLAADYFALLHCQQSYEAWDPSVEEMPKFGRRFVIDEIDNLHKNINGCWKAIQLLVRLDQPAAMKAKEDANPLAKLRRRVPTVDDVEQSEKESDSDPENEKCKVNCRRRIMSLRNFLW